MNNTNVKKINTLGKVANVFVIILKVCLIVGIVGCIVGGVAMMALPNDFMSVKADGNAQIVMKNDELTEHLISFGNYEELQESNLDYKGFGYTLKWIVDKTDNGDGSTTYDIDAAVDGVSGKEIKISGALACFGGALVLALALVSAVFAGRLTKALAACESPFEEKVIKAMKAFGYSLIPWAVVKFFMGNLSAIVTVLLVCVVLLFVRVFSYGAELQKQSDETL